MPNRLGEEISPYLLQHAHNPVDWYPWTPEAFQLAREQDKPIFLSIGYAACHWCHVMAHESFEDPETAAIMNEHFINIKVDREERPEIDSIYMDAVVALTGQGGWPMSVFLTPEGDPFYGGTYFPPTSRVNIPAFKDVLLHISREWAADRARMLDAGAALRRHIIAQSNVTSSRRDLDDSNLDRAAQALFRAFDWTHGGWGSAPKFPQASTIEFLLRKYIRSRDSLALEMATLTLDRMAAGGIYDQVGGGFHRYSVDERWLVPHFEKMLYDNALLCREYLHAWTLTQQSSYRKVAEQTLAFLMREMRHPDGGFFASLDADSEGEEGRFYIWSSQEIDAIVRPNTHRDIVAATFGVTEEGNFEGANILHRVSSAHDLATQFGLAPEEVTAQLDEGLRALLEAREARERPFTDDKIILAWNGLMLTTLAEAARYLNNPDYLAAAQQLADFLLRELRIEGVLARIWRNGEVRTRAFLDDHAAFAQGLLTLYQVDFNLRWFEAAEQIAAVILERFKDPAGGFFDTADDHETLIARPKTIQDSPTPSGTSLALSVLAQLYALTGETRYMEPVESSLGHMQDNAARYPTAFAAWLNNLDFHLGPVHQLALVGDPNDPQFKTMASLAQRLYQPNFVLAGGSPDSEGQPALLHGRASIEGRPSAYLCVGFSCKLPTNELDQLQTLLAPFDTAAQV